jgi:hypothetical protein
MNMRDDPCRISKLVISNICGSSDQNRWFKSVFQLRNQILECGKRVVDVQSSLLA